MMELIRQEATSYLGLVGVENIRIKDKHIRSFVVGALILAPEEFFWIPASSTGKYHPSYALGVGGLLRHTKACMVIAEELFPLYKFDDTEKDVIMAALVLHDLCKPSKTHPIEVRPLLEELRNDYPGVFPKIMNLIESHMGQWDHYGKLPRPQTELQHFVHLCDYLASRKAISVELG